MTEMYLVLLYKFGRIDYETIKQSSQTLLLCITDR